MTVVYTALVLAGSRGGNDPVAAAHGAAFKFQVDVLGEPMLARVLGALSRSRSVGRIAVCGPSAAVAELLATAELPDVAVIEGAASPSRSVLHAAEALGGPWPLLVTTADHPLLTPEIIDSFCERAHASGAAVAAGLASASVILAEFPGTRRTFLRFRDGAWSGCNLFVLRDASALAAARFWRRVEDERKRPWRIARAFGLLPLLLFASGRLCLDQAMRRASRVIGVDVAAVELEFAAAAVDVDRPADLALVESAIRRRDR